MQIDDFVLKDAQHMYSVAIIGKNIQSNLLVKTLLDHFDCQTVLSLRSSSKTAKFEEESVRSHAYSETILEEFVNAQILSAKEHRRKQRDSGELLVAPQSCVVFDDCMRDIRWSNKFMRILYLNGKTFHTRKILIMERSVAILPIFRHDLDYVFVFGDLQRNDLQSTFDFYAQTLPENVKQVFQEKTTDPFTCMVIDNTCCETNVSWYTLENPASSL